MTADRLAVLGWSHKLICYYCSYYWLL